MSSPLPFAEQIRDAALALGFCRVGFTPVERLQPEAAALDAWLAAGHQGDMHYMAEQPRDVPTQMLPQARTLIVVALAYANTPEPVAPTDAATGPRGVIARYARGADYHGVLKEKLTQLATRCAAIVGRPIVARPCVDSAPLLERGYAARAGVGFVAKSTMSIVSGVGSYVLLGELLVDIDLPAALAAPSKCGQCRLCLDACPTGAFVGPYVLDARRCISYLTIELRGSIPAELRPLMGNMVFGCDICQQVCPFNASSKPKPAAAELAPRAALQAPPLLDLLTLGSADYRKLVRNSAMRRTSRHQLARNAAVALGNSGDRSVVPTLAQTLRQHISPLVRGHVAWALGRLGGRAAEAALQDALLTEQDTTVRDEIGAALGSAAQASELRE